MLRLANALGDSAAAQTQLRLKSALLEITLSNAGANDLFAEVYTVKSRGFYSSGGTFASAYSAGLTGAPAALTGGTSLTTGTYGATPFLNREWCSSWKIVSKQTVKLAVGASTNLVLKARPARIRNLDDNQLASYAADRYTMGYIIVHYGIPNTTTGVPVATTIAWNAVKTYLVESPRSAGLTASAQTLTS